MWKWVKRIYPSEHRWATRQLSAYLDSELSPSDRARVEAHLKECRICLEELSTLRWTVSLTAQMPMLKAPRSFMITEAIAQPPRPPFGLAYVYLRSATVAVAALLLIVLAGDFLWPYRLSPIAPGPQTLVRKALPAAEEAMAEREATEVIPVEKVVEKEVVLEREVIKEAPVEEVVREGPAETVVVEREMVVEEAPVAMEVVKEVQVEKEAEEPALLKAPVLGAEKTAIPLPAATPAPPTGIAESGELEAKQVAPLVEQASKEEIEQEPVISAASSAERASDRAVVPTESGVEGKQEVPAWATTVAPVAATPTSTRALPTPTLPLPQPVVEKAVPSPQPTSLPPAASAAEKSEPARRPSPPRRSAVRLIEYALGSLVVLLAGSTLVLRPRRR